MRTFLKPSRMKTLWWFVKSFRDAQYAGIDSLNYTARDGFVKVGLLLVVPFVMEKRNEVQVEGQCGV